MSEDSNLSITHPVTAMVYCTDKLQNTTDSLGYIIYLLNIAFEFEIQYTKNKRTSEFAYNLLANSRMF